MFPAPASAAQPSALEGTGQSLPASPPPAWNMDIMLGLNHFFRWQRQQRPEKDSEATVSPFPASLSSPRIVCSDWARSGRVGGPTQAEEYWKDVRAPG